MTDRFVLIAVVIAILAVYVDQQLAEYRQYSAPTSLLTVTDARQFPEHAVIVIDGQRWYVWWALDARTLEVAPECISAVTALRRLLGRATHPRRAV